MKNILIIDDHLNENLDLDELFLENDFKIHTAFGITNGIEIAIRYFPDLIILNIADEKSGHKLISSLNNYEQTNTTPLLYLSELL